MWSISESYAWEWTLLAGRTGCKLSLFTTCATERRQISLSLSYWKSFLPVLPWKLSHCVLSFSYSRVLECHSFGESCPLVYWNFVCLMGEKASAWALLLARKPSCATVCCSHLVFLSLRVTYELGENMWFSSKGSAKTIPQSPLAFSQPCLVEMYN